MPVDVVRNVVVGSSKSLPKKLFFLLLLNLNSCLTCNGGAF